MTILIFIVTVVFSGLFLSSKNEALIFKICKKLFGSKNEYKFYLPDFKLVKFAIVALLFTITVTIHIIIAKPEYPLQSIVLGVIVIAFIFLSKKTVAADKRFANINVFGTGSKDVTYTSVSKDKIYQDLVFLFPFFTEVINLQNNDIDKKADYFLNYLDKNKGYDLKPKESEKYKYQIKVLIEYFLTQKYNLNKEINLRINILHSSKIRIIDLMFRLMVFDENYLPETEELIKSTASKLKVSKAVYDKIKHKYIEEKSDFKEFADFIFSSSENNENAYKILGVNPDSSNEDIKKAYRQLAKKYHPDKFEYLGDKEKQKALEMFIIIQNAFDSVAKEKNL